MPERIVLSVEDQINNHVKEAISDAFKLIMDVPGFAEMQKVATPPFSELEATYFSNWENSHKGNEGLRNEDFLTLVSVEVQGFEYHFRRTFNKENDSALVTTNIFLNFHFKDPTKKINIVLRPN